MVQPVLQRVVYLLSKQGRIEIPTVNGREVKIKSVSPLAQAQSNQDIVSLDRFLEMVAGRFGPEVVNLLVSSEETAIYLAKKFGVPDHLIRDVGERQQMVQMAQQMQQQTGIDPNANPNIQALGG
jgi:phage portal protein BeeE